MLKDIFQTDNFIIMFQASLEEVLYSEGCFYLEATTQMAITAPMLLPTFLRWGVAISK